MKDPGIFVLLPSEEKGTLRNSPKQQLYLAFDKWVVDALLVCIRLKSSEQRSHTCFVWPCGIQVSQYRFHPSLSKDTLNSLSKYPFYCSHSAETLL